MTPTEVKKADSKSPSNGTSHETKNTITLSFDAVDRDLYSRIVKAAAEDERPVSQYLLRLVRKHFTQPAQ